MLQDIICYFSNNFFFVRNNAKCCLFSSLELYFITTSRCFSSGHFAEADERTEKNATEPAQNRGSYAASEIVNKYFAIQANTPMRFSLFPTSLRISNNNPHLLLKFVARFAIHIPEANACVRVGISVTSVNASTSKNVVYALPYVSLTLSTERGSNHYLYICALLPHPVTFRPKNRARALH